MIIKKNFNPVKVFHYVAIEIFISIAMSFSVLILYLNNILSFTLPFSVIGIIGSALAIFIGFRNNSSYNRWWEARTLWAGIVNSSRVLGRLFITFTDSHSHQQNYNKDRSEKFKKDMIYLIIAWVHSIRIYLRGLENWFELKPYLSEEDFKETESKDNKSNYLQLLIGKKIYEAMGNGTLGGFDSFQIEGQLLSLANFYSGCERIKFTPLLRQYNYFTNLFLYTFIILFPFSLIGEFSKMGKPYLVVPVSLLVSFVFAIIGKVGEVNEDPFENKITDIPLNSLCNTIERDLKEMLGETNLPPKTFPKDGIIF